MKRITLFFLSIIALAFGSCLQNNSTQTKLMQAEQLMNERPDSSLYILNTITNPAELNEANYAYFLLLHTQAKDKNNLNIAGDTLIQFAVDYFSRQKDISHAAHACFYTNRVNSQRGKLKPAIEYCLKAKEFAEQTNENNLLGLIHFDLAEIYKTQALYNKASVQYLLAQNYFEQSGNEQNKMYISAYIADTYLFRNELDSAMYLYNQTLDYAQSIQDTFKIAELLKDMSNAYFEKGMYALSQQYAQQAIETEKNDTTLLVNAYKLLVMCYLNDNKIDSANYYVRQIQPLATLSDNIYNKYGYYKLLYQINKIQKNYGDALGNREMMSVIADSISVIERNNFLLEILSKYEISLLENKFNKTKLHQQSLIIYSCIISIFILILTGLLIMNQQKKEKMKLKIQHTTNMLEDLLFQKENLNNELTKYFIEKLDIATKYTKLQLSYSDKKLQIIDEYREIMGPNDHQSLDWDAEIYPAINYRHNQFVNKLKTICPHLEEIELRICCLIRNGLRNEEIAFFLGYTRNSIDTKKSIIRKKLDFETMDELIKYLHKL